MFFGRFGHSGMMGGNGLRLIICVVGFFIFLIVIMAAVLITVKILRHKSHHEFHQGGNIPGNYRIYAGKALEILNERYAKGEIDDEEYTKKKAELTKY